MDIKVFLLKYFISRDIETKAILNNYGSERCSDVKSIGFALHIFSSTSALPPSMERGVNNEHCWV